MKIVAFAIFYIIQNIFSVDDLDVGSNVNTSSLGRKAERGYVRDWQRLGLTTESFRLCAVNLTYSFCRR